MSDYRVLARTYRPQNFTDVRGQDFLITTLEHAFERNRLAHAFVLTGVRGVGKTTTARIMAKALNCPDRQGANPCGMCETCQAIEQGKHLDVIEMDAASQTGTDDIRRLTENASYRPVQGQYKVFIIDEVHMLSKGAFNALLKTLEEPHDHTKFILATTEIRKVPITVLSRCQRFDLRRFTPDLLADYLMDIAKKESIELPAEGAQAIARAADGSARDGLSLLDQAIVLCDTQTLDIQTIHDMLGVCDHTVVARLLTHVIEGEADKALSVLGTLYEQGINERTLIQDLLALLHGLSVYKAAKVEANTPAVQAFCISVADRISLRRIGFLWQVLTKSISDLCHDRAAMEMLVVRLIYSLELDTQIAVQSAQASRPSADPPTASAASASPTTSNEPTSSEAKKKSVESKTLWRKTIGQYEQWTEMFKDNREMILYYHLCHDMVYYGTQGKQFFVGAQVDKSIVQKANKYGALWSPDSYELVITEGTTQDGLSVANYHKLIDKEKKSAAALHPLVQSFRDCFSGAVISAVKK
jgi:DNA polymerase-3 subunit gamma/tau